MSHCFVVHTILAAPIMIKFLTETHSSPRTVSIVASTEAALERASFAW